MNYGMQQMTHRTTFALDEETAKRIKRLAARWNVSQAEVVRRSVAQVESAEFSRKADPAALLQALHDSGEGLAEEAASSYLADVREDRKFWRQP